MRKIFWFVLMTLLGINSSYGQWNSKDLDPEEYYMYHNDAKGDNENTCLVLLTVNGKWLTQEELSDYAFYVVGYYEENFGTPKKPKWVTVCESFGTCQITNLGETASFSPTLGANPDLGTSDETDPDYDPATDPTLWSLYTDFAVSNAGKSNLSISCLDYTCGTSLVEFEVVIVNTKTGYYGKSEVLPGKTQNVEINIVDPTLKPSTGPTITVEPIIAGCWSDGGTFDLTKAKKNVSDGATVEYYTDESGNVPIPDPTKVAMPANPSSPTQVVKYYAKAISADGTEESDIQEISVTFYQKPDVSLALSDGKTKVCYNALITLTTKKVNSFTDGTYQYYSGNAALNVDGGSSYETNATASTTYYVYVTSGGGGCKDTASVKVEVIPAIPAGEIQISVDPNKTEICAGESLKLTASVTKKYSGVITYQWGSEVDDADRNKEEITVKPLNTTDFTVNVKLDGCPASGGGDTQRIVVNQLPVLTVADPDPVCETTVNITQTGAGNYTYYKDADLTTKVLDATKVGAGDYYVTLTDAKGCTSEKGMVTAVVNPNPTPKILVNGVEPKGDALCEGTEIKLSCDNSTYKTYTWTGVTDATDSYEQNAKIVAGASNSFGLKVVDVNKCEGTATTVAITGKAAPEVTIENIGEACKGDEVTLKATITWATKEQSILWEGNELNVTNINPTTATLGGGDNKYKLTITDQNNCEAKDSITVKGNVIETLQKDLTINPTSVKAGETVSLDITATWNGTPLDKNAASYTWKKTVSASESPLAKAKAITDAPDANSTYKVVVEKNGCKDSVSGDVEVKTDPFELAGIDGYRAVCDEEDLTTNPMKLYVTASGGQKDYTYKWTYPAGMSVESDNSDTLKIISIDYTKMLAGGSHDVSVVVEDAIGAKDSKTIPFEVRELPTIKINDVNGGAILQACKDGVMNLQASVSNGTVKGYLWSTGGTLATISASTDAVGTTSYIVTATTDVGCTNKDSVKVEVNKLPEIKLTAELDGVEKSIVCKGTVITLNATVTGVDAPDLVWSNTGLNGANPTSTVEKKTTYEVAYRDPSTTCEAKTKVEVGVFSVVNLDVNVKPSLNVCPNTEVTLTASNGASYQWFADGTEMSGEINETLKVKPASDITYTVEGKDENGCKATLEKPIKITIDEAPVLVLSKTTLDGCVGGPDVDLAAAVDITSTPGASLKVKNSNNDILPGITVNTSGIYTLFLDNGSNCTSNEKTVEVIFHKAPNVSFHPSIAEVCSGIEVTLTASSTDTKQPTFTYGGTDNTIWKVKPENTGSANTSITYTVTAKDSYGCTNTADAEVTVKPLPKVKIADPGAVCEASQVTLSAEGATTYAWSGAAQSGNAPTYEVQPTSKVNKFYVTGTDENGCKGKDSITLTVNEVPVLAEAKPFSECDKTEINLEKAFVEGGYTLSFYDENQDPISGSNIIVDGDKTYYAKASNKNCTSFDFTPISVKAKTLPSVSIEEIGEICAGEEVELKASGENIVSYLWSPAGKGNVTSGATITANPSVTTEYIVTARGNNNCTNTDTVKVKVNPLPELKWDAGNPSDLIAGEKKTWNVIFKKETTPEYTYTWLQNGIINPNFPNNNYSLKGGTVNPEKLAVCVTDGKGCTSDTLKTSVTVTPQGGELMITLTAESEDICQGGMQILTATPSGGESPYTYVWYKVGEEAIIAQGVSSITVTEAGTYKVSVTDAGVTKQTKEASIEMKISTSLAPTVTVADLTIPKGNSTILLPTVTPANGSYTYQWSEVANLKDADQATLVNPETKILTSDTPYDLVVKDGNGCYSKKATGTVYVNNENGFKVVASVDLNKVCLDNPAQLNATLDGKVSDNVTYEWIPATGLSATDIANPVFSSATPDVFDFIVKVTDNTSGSVAVAKVTVEAENKTAPTLALAPASGNSCVGEAITVTADGVSEYQWIIDGRDPIVGGNSLNTLVAGNHKVKVTATATNGCVITPVEGNYQIHDLPTIAFDPNTPGKVDKGTKLTVTAIADDGASGNYTYTWSSPEDGIASQATYTIVMDDAQTFTVSVKDNVTGCVSGEISTDVTVQKPTSPVEITVNSESVLLCQYGVSLLEVTGVKGGNGIENEFSDYRYEWTKSGDANVLSTEKSYTATADGTYTVKVTEPNTGKSTTKDITVTNSSLSAPLVADATLTIQKGEQAFLFAKVTGGTPDYTYCWSPLGSISTSITTPYPTTSALSASETFTCYVTDANKCSGKGEIQVNVAESTDQKLFTLVAKADNTNPCMGNTVNLTATPSRELTNATYEWTPATGLSAANIANPIFTPATLGTTIFTVKVTEQGAYSRTAQVAVTVQSNEAPHLALTDNTGGCAGEVLTATNTNGNVTVTKYHWVIDGTPDNEKTGETYPLGAGAGQTVKVYATAANGCASDTASGVFSRKPTPEIKWDQQPASAKEEEDFKLSVKADADVKYVWSYIFTPEGGVAQPAKSGANRDYFEKVGAEKGTYAFTVYVEKDGCKSEELPHTVTVLDKDAGLTVTTDPKGEQQICANGSIIVTATAFNGSGKYTFNWYAGTAVSGNPVATGATVMLSPTVNGQKYVVEVNDGLTTAVSLPVTLTFNNNTAPTIAGGTQNVAKGQSTILLSKVTQGAAASYHWSSPNDLLVSGDETKANPATKPLSDDETYTYYVKDANGCISKPADVKVVVDKAADALAIEATADMVNLCLGNVSHFKVSATKGTLSADAVYEWTPSTNLTGEKTAEPVFTTTTGGNYPYLVTVRDQGKVLVASVTVTVKALQVPEFAWDEPNCTPSYNTVGDPIKVTTKVTKETTKPYTYHWLKPSDVKNQLHDYSVQTTTQSQYDFAVVMIDANGCQTADTLKKHIEAGAAVVEIEINAENVSVCALPEGVDGTATLSVIKTAGPDNVTYDWKPKSGNTLTLTDADKANAIVNLSGVVAGDYTFTVKVSDANDNTNYAEKDVKLTVNKLPVFQIDEHCLALHKDSLFTLNVANTGDYSYLWRVSMYDKSQKQWGTPIQKGDNKYCEVQMSNQDMRYILKVEDNSTSLHCAAFDTAYVYRIPDAPLVEIDTNTSRLNIKLEWATVSGNDGYTVWSRKWDPYCMTSADGGVYKATATPHNILTEAATDSLKFYYVTADRNVCGKTYYSLASDTVGYYLYDIQMNPAGKASLNHLAIYFDMSKNGKQYMAKDILTALPLNLAKEWDFGNQVWQNAKMMGKACIGDFKVIPGMVIQVEPKSACQYMQYGKLSLPLTTLLLNTNTEKSNLSHSYLWLHRLNLKDAKDIFNAHSGKFKLVKMWNFSNQVWKNARMMGGSCVGIFDLEPLLPLQFELEKDNVQW